MLYKLRLSLLAFALLFSAAQSASAIPLANGETLRIRFELPAPPNSPQVGGIPSNPLNIADVLSGTLNVTRISGIGAPSVHFDLFDGSTLLGGYDLVFATPFTSFNFSDPSSVFDFRSTQVSSLSSLEDGTIDGIIEITNTSAALFDYSVSRLVAGHTVAVSTIHQLTPTPVITFAGRPQDDPNTTVTSVNEPNSFILFCLGIAGLAFAQFGRRLFKDTSMMFEEPIAARKV